MDIGSDFWLVIKNHPGINDPPPDREPGWAGQNGILRARGNAHLLVLPSGGQTNRAGQPLTVSGQRASIRPGGGLFDPSRKTDTRQIAAVDLKRILRPTDQADICTERAEVRIPPGIEPERAITANNLRPEIGKTDPQARTAGQ